MNIKDMIDELIQKITSTKTTTEDYCLSLDCVRKEKESFSVAIEFQADNFDELRIYGVIPPEELFATLTDNEDDENMYCGIPVNDFISNCIWNIVKYSIDEL